MNYVQDVFNNRELILNFVKQHHQTLLVTWYVWSLVSYLFVREFKNVPLKMVLHRLFVLGSFVSAGLLTLIVYVTGIHLI